jgi:hypothetical protein
MGVRILIPGRKVDEVAYRCEKCGVDIHTRSSRVLAKTSVSAQMWLTPLSKSQH